MAIRETPAADTAAPTPEQIEAALAAHPEVFARFVLDHPDLLADLLPERALGGNVADLQAYALRHLRAEMDDVRVGAEELIRNARDNMSIQSRTHQAVLALLAAESFDGLMRAVTDELPMLLQVDVVVPCFEAGLPKGAAIYVQELRSGAVERLLGGAETRLRGRLPGDPDSEAELWGSGSGLVRSDALVRLPLGDALPPAVLALGSRDPGTFRAGQGTELLTFLATVLGHCVRRWVHP